jgi:hypothetical protein
LSTDLSTRFPRVSFEKSKQHQACCKNACDSPGLGFLTIESADTNRSISKRKMVEISAWESDNQQQSGNNNQHPSSPSSQDHHSTTETPWTDAQVRWSKEEGVPEKEEEEPDFFDPFADPDPTQVFTFVFVVPNQPPQLDANSKMNELAADDEYKLDSSSALSSKIELKIQGYKTHSDQVWQSTGLTLWKASKYLCDYMVAHAPELQNKRILEVRLVPNTLQQERTIESVILFSHVSLCCLQRLHNLFSYYYYSSERDWG